MTIRICKRKNQSKQELFTSTQFTQGEFLILNWETHFTIVAYLSSKQYNWFYETSEQSKQIADIADFQRSPEAARPQTLEISPVMATWHRVFSPYFV